MYEMYPDSWRADERAIDQATGGPDLRQQVAPIDADSHQDVSSERPRRRARKQHSVQPAVIARADAAR